MAAPWKPSVAHAGGGGVWRRGGCELAPQARGFRLQKAGAHLTSSYPISLWTLLPD